MKLHALTAALLAVGIGFPDWASTCTVRDGDFEICDAGAACTYWINENEGPGLPSADEGIVDVDGRTAVLRLDSRAGSNYYLFRTQEIACAMPYGTFTWDWKLELEAPYGLAGMWLWFYDAGGERLGAFFVRRHTGDFAAYDCSALLAESRATYPSQAFGCEEEIGTDFGWETGQFVFNWTFFSGLTREDGSMIDPSSIAKFRVILQSYNNAGAGVDAYFDNIQLEQNPVSVDAASWGSIKATYR